MEIKKQVRNRVNHRMSAGGIAVLEKTTCLAAIQKRSLLVLVDEQNLSHSAGNLGYSLKCKTLARRIRAASKEAEIHLFTAANAGDEKAARKFNYSGYITHVKTIRLKPLPGGRQRRDSNIDNLFSYWTGLLTVSKVRDMVILASGDYGLAGELAEAIHSHDAGKNVEIVTLSLPGSTSQDLDAEKNQHITANLEIGLDLLAPLARSISQFSARALGGYRAFRYRNFINPSF